MKFQCSSCPKTFSRRSSLRNHRKIHDTKLEKCMRETSTERYLREIDEEKRNNSVVLNEPNKQLENQFNLESILNEEIHEEIIGIMGKDIDKETGENIDKETGTRKEMNMEIDTREIDFEINVREMDIDIRNEIKDKGETDELEDEREMNEVEGDQV
jgi:hypothetical protein